MKHILQFLFSDPLNDFVLHQLKVRQRYSKMLNRQQVLRSIYDK